MILRLALAVSLTLSLFSMVTLRIVESESDVKYGRGQLMPVPDHPIDVVNVSLRELASPPEIGSAKHQENAIADHPEGPGPLETQQADAFGYGISSPLAAREGFETPRTGYDRIPPATMGFGASTLPSGGTGAVDDPFSAFLVETNDDSHSNPYGPSTLPATPLDHANNRAGVMADVTGFTN